MMKEEISLNSNVLRASYPYCLIPSMPPLSVEAFDALLLLGCRDVRRVSVAVETNLAGRRGSEARF